MFCSALLCVHSSFAIIFAFLSSWCLVIVVSLFLKVPRFCMQFFICYFRIIITHYFNKDSIPKVISVLEGVHYNQLESSDLCLIPYFV